MYNSFNSKINTYGPMNCTVSGRAVISLPSSINSVVLPFVGVVGCLLYGLAFSWANTSLNQTSSSFGMYTVSFCQGGLVPDQWGVPIYRSLCRCKTFLYLALHVYYVSYYEFYLKHTNILTTCKSWDGHLPIYLSQLVHDMTTGLLKLLKSQEMELGAYEVTYIILGTRAEVTWMPVEVAWRENA